MNDDVVYVVSMLKKILFFNPEMNIIVFKAFAMPHKMPTFDFHLLDSLKSVLLAVQLG